MYSGKQNIFWGARARSARRFGAVLVVVRLEEALLLFGCFQSLLVS
jgi:hypothetical protein